MPDKMRQHGLFMGREVFYHPKALAQSSPLDHRSRILCHGHSPNGSQVRLS
jgi:hypothetical protein